MTVYGNENIEEIDLFEGYLFESLTKDVNVATVNPRNKAMLGTEKN
jgi:hypothetical protein